MRIFYELSHTSCDVEIMKSGFDFDVLHPGWDERGRPKPANARLVEKPEGTYRASVVSTGHGLALSPPGVPIIWKCFVDFGQWPKPGKDVYDRLEAWTALCRESVDRFGMADDPKAHVIEPGIDTDIFGGYTGATPRVLTVGHLIPQRPEKGPGILQEAAARVPIDIMGVGNEGLSHVKILGHAPDVSSLAMAYRSYRVYFNPSSVICCSVLEAMASGCPVVTMTPGNFKDLMSHRENCFIADDVPRLAYFLNLLIDNPIFAHDVGLRAQASVKYRFHPAICAYKWKRLIESCVR